MQAAKGIDEVFLATVYEVSHDITLVFLATGCVVFDLSAVFRVRNASFYRQYYGFEHQHDDLLDQAVYGLPEWQSEQIKQAQFIAVPGCYPTAA